MYAVISDVHLHNWSAFSQTNPDGVNSRLRYLLLGIEAVCVALRTAGGKRLYITGDLFHVRGSVAPSVVNPTIDVIKANPDIEFRIIPGNHDLEHKESDKLGSAIEILRELPNVTVYSEPTYEGGDGVLVMPWYDKLDALRIELKNNLIDIVDSSRVDLMIHAPLNGVITSMPDHGLSAEELRAFGFKRVFVGHHHHHKRFYGDAVMSVGALAHHTWSDVDTLAGYLLVDDTTVTHVELPSPKFVDVDGGMAAGDIPALVKGNYVRAKMTSTKREDEAKLREFLIKSGARGVLIQNVRAPTTEREANAAVHAGASVEQSVLTYMKGKTFTHQHEVEVAALQLLAEVSA